MPRRGMFISRSLRLRTGSNFVFRPYRAYCHSWPDLTQAVGLGCGTTPLWGFCWQM